MDAKYTPMLESMSAKRTSMLESPTCQPLKDATAVRRMFADIAPTYDFLNHLLSINLDRSWRRRAVRLADLSAGDRVLDVCTGTGDLAFEAARTIRPAAGGRVIGTDFCPEMVHLATHKQAGREVRFGVADTLRLPFPDSSFDVVTVGFGIRNVAGLVPGLAEMRRVLSPGGRALVLELTTPRSTLLRHAFGLYFSRVLPRIGRWLCAAKHPDQDDAYRYLPNSVGAFPRPEGLVEKMELAGFVNVRYWLLTLGVAAIHVGEKPGIST